MNNAKSAFIENLPVVSVIVITYNSAKYVLETLNSIKEQTYKNIELIISDDCSTDNTVSILEKWVDANGDRFKTIKIVKAVSNTGIAPNCNRGLENSKGEWVKLIAGDDMLYPVAIEMFMKFVRENKECKLVFGRSHTLKNKTIYPDMIPKTFYMNSADQKIEILKGSGVASVGAFINRDILNAVGGFDENYPMIEDAPLWVKLSERNIHFHFLNQYVAIYRKHDNNISHTSVGNKYINTSFLAEQKKFFIKIIIPKLINNKLYLNALHLHNYLSIMNVIVYFGNKKTLFSKILSLLVIKNTINRVKFRMLSLLNKR